MKRIRRSALAAVMGTAGIFLGSIFVTPAQLISEATKPDSVVAVVADAQGLPLVPAEQLPWHGTFWIVRNSVPCVIAPLPCPPLDPSLPIYAISDHQFLVDETAGPMMVRQIGKNSLSLLQRISFVVTRHSDTILDDLENIGVPVDCGNPEGLRTRRLRDASKSLANTATMVWLQPLGNPLQALRTLEHGRRPHGSEPFLNAIERAFVNLSREQACVGVRGDAQHGAVIIHHHQPARTRLKNRLHIQIPVSRIHA